MPHPMIDAEKCSSCGSCMDICPNGVLDMVDDRICVIDADACVACYACVDECPTGALEGIGED